MKSARAEELRLILPFALRLATVDFFGTDDFRARVEVVFGFEVVRDLVPDEERDDREDDRPLFCAVTCTGAEERWRPERLQCASTYRTFPVAHYRAFKRQRQVKAGC
jgi:hypothetical protein